MQESEQEILLNTLAETPQEEVRTLEEDIYVIGVESLNGKAGDLTLKNINGEDLVGTGNITLATQSAFNDLSATVATKQDALTETQLAAVNSGIDSSKVQQIADNTTAIAGKQDQLTQTQLNAVNSGIDETKVAQITTNTGNITSNTNRITTIEGKIPSAATSTNQLTDKSYVDNAIATNTADYISDNGQPFQSLADLEAYAGPLTNNDYAFVVSTDSAGNLLYTRYKYNADQELWAEEYTIANPTFTSTQWAAIDSGVTANDVTQIGTNKSDIANLQSGKQDALSQTQLDAVNSGIDATKVQQIATNASNITSLQTDKQDKLIAGTNIQIAADGKTISATDTTYTAGTGLTLTGTQFSVTEPVPTGFFTDTAATQEGTGTTITLNNTADAPIDNVELKGDTYQFTTTGKNLFSGAWGQFDNIGGTGTTYGYFKLADASGDYTLSLRAKNDISVPTPLKYLGFTANGGDAQGGFSWAYNSNAPLTKGETAYVYNYRENTKYYCVSIYPNTEYTFNWFMSNFDIQLEKGRGVTPYEPYTAGASPNPSYPQDIQVVTGEQTVKVVGKNICSGTKISGGNHQAWFKLPKLTSGNIVLSTILNESLSGNTIALVIGEQSQGTLGSITATAGTRFSFSCSLSEQQIQVVNNSSDAWLRIYNSTANFTTPTDPMIEYGSTATAYEPYQSQSYEVNLGKNLWGGFASSVPREGLDLSFVNNADGTISVSSGTTSAQHVSLLTSLAVSNNHYITLKAGSYVVSGGTANIGLQVLDTSGALLGTSTFTLTTEKQVYVRAVVESGVTVTATTIKPQLELGTTATSYAPYFTPIELCKIGDYQDYIWKDGSDWKVHKAIEKVVLDGTEDWVLLARDGHNNYYMENMAPNNLYIGSAATYMSNYYTGIPTDNRYADGTFFINTTGRGIFTYDAITTKDLFKTWLSTHNTNVYYILNTAADTQITDAALIAQLDALAGSTTYAPQTNYTTSTTSPNLPTILTVDVFKNNYAGLLARLNKAGA